MFTLLIQYPLYKPLLEQGSHIVCKFIRRKGTVSDILKVVNILKLTYYPTCNSISETLTLPIQISGIGKLNVGTGIWLYYKSDSYHRKKYDVNCDKIHLRVFFKF